MKAISIRQPWANLIAAGGKTIEVRTRPTKYRGPLLIVSAKRPTVPPGRLRTDRREVPLWIERTPAQ